VRRKRRRALIDDDVETKKLKIKTDPGDEDSDEIEIRATVFDEGDAEGWIKWRIQMDELIRDMQLETGRQKIVLAKALLKGNAREKFIDILTDMAVNNSDVEDVELVGHFDEAIERLGLDYFPSENAYRRQRNYLRYHVFMIEMTLSDFRAELRRQNNFLRYFPIPNDRTSCESLPDDELVEIVDRAKRVEWQRDLLTANIDPYAMTLDDFYRYLEKLEVKYNIDKALRDKKRKSGLNDDDATNKPNKRSKKDKKGSNAKGKQGNFTREKPCVHCNKMHPVPDDKCWSLDKNKDSRPERGTSPKKETERMFSALQMEQITKALKGKAARTKKPKRQVTYNMKSETTSDEGSSSDSDSADNGKNVSTMYAIRTTQKSQNKKDERLTTELLITLVSPIKDSKPVRCLLDTGTTRSIVLKQFMSFSHNIQKKKHPTKWQTLSGSLTTDKIADMHFILPDLSTSKQITWPCHVDEVSSRDKVPYDIILGLDFLIELKFTIDFDKRIIRWGENQMEMTPHGLVTDKEAFQYLYQAQQEGSPVLQKAEERQAKILDADYSKVDLEDYVTSLNHLTLNEQTSLLNTLRQFPTLFGGGLGKHNIYPVRLELKEGSKPYHAKPFAVPQAYLTTTKKEIERFEKLGIWKRVNDSPWTAASFIQPKKTGDVRVLTDFRKLNEWIVRRPHPLPKISDLLQRLEGFRYATAIDLSMGYYHIPLDKYSQGLCGTVMPWGIYQYKVLPMGISNAPDIFQSIMMRLLGDLDFVHVYMDDILITSNEISRTTCPNYKQYYNGWTVQASGQMLANALSQPIESST
jgi:hypothetical protein